MVTIIGKRHGVYQERNNKARQNKKSLTSFQNKGAFSLGKLTKAKKAHLI